jgi:hypothetical protein
MNLSAEQLRAIILAEAQKIENEQATRLEEEFVDLDLEALRAIIQEEAQLFEAGSKLAEEEVYEEGDLNMNEHGDAPWDERSDDDAGFMDRLSVDAPDPAHDGGELSDPHVEYSELEEDTFHREEMHDDMDVDRLRRLRDALNDHIHNLETQHGRAERRHEELGEGDALPDELAEEVVGEASDEDAGQKATDKFAQGKTLSAEEEEAMQKHQAEKLKKGLGLEESSETLSESATRPDPAISRWMKIAGL